MSAYAEGRFELKYAIPCHQRQRIVDLLQGNAVPDEHGVDIGGGAVGYFVYSLYFDTPNLDDYFQRLASRRVRDRLRVRTYGAPGEKQPAFLENKRKYEERVVKHRVRLCDADEWAGCDSPHPWQAFRHRAKGRGRFALQDFALRVEDGVRLPKTVVSYRREVFVTANPEVRIRLTMDHDVGATPVTDARDLYAAPTRWLLPRDWMVLELKFDGDKPGWMRRICKDLHLRAEPVSKFGLSMVHCHRPGRYAEVRFYTPHSVRQAGLFESAA